MDLTAQVSRVDAPNSIDTPFAIDEQVRGWMHRALLAGAATNIRLRLAGFADFPFHDGKVGNSKSGQGAGVTLDYAAGWPVARDVEADVRVDGARLTVDIGKGRIFGAELGRTRVDIADLRAANPLLHIDGSATGQTTDFARYIVDSPLDVTLGHPVAGIEVSGDGKLALKLELPIGKPDAVNVAGDYTIDNGRIQFADGTPPLERLSGKILFTAHDVSAPGMVGELLGGPARFSVGTAEGRLRVDGQGSLNLALLRAAYPKLSLLTRFSGTTDWKVAVNGQPAGLAWVLDSTLKGAVVDLPAPAGKSAAETIVLRVERASANRDTH
jgi:uncharacterized protein YhdP